MHWCVDHAFPKIPIYHITTVSHASLRLTRKIPVEPTRAS
jgi:hypothetical protein